MDNTLIGNIIFSASADGLTLVGMNQDNPKTHATFKIIPSMDGKPGKVIFGSDDEFESGVNEKGLMIGLSPAPTVEVEYPEDKLTLEGSQWHSILDSCSSVADVLEILNEHNVVGLESCQAFIADPSGDAAIIGVGDNKQIKTLKKDGWYLILSGSIRYQTEIEKQADYRYDVAGKMLAEKTAVSFQSFRDILSITHGEGSHATIYSVIYDLTKKDIYLYYFHDFSHGIKFNLDKALDIESAPRTLKTPSLLPIKHAYYAQIRLEETKPHAEKKQVPSKTSRKSHRTTHLSTIEGIGDVYENRLKEIGIHSVEDLLTQGATPKGRLEISERSNIRDNLILAWVNRADLCRIKGVGSEYSDLLELAGVDTVPELAQRIAESLYEKLVETNLQKMVVRVLPSQSQVDEWISLAKDLPRIVFY